MNLLIVALQTTASGIAAECFGKTVHDDEVERHLGWVSPYARYGPGHRQAAQACQAR